MYPLYDQGLSFSMPFNSVCYQKLTRQDQCDFNQETKYLRSFAFVCLNVKQVESNSNLSAFANGSIRPRTSKHLIII